MAVGRGYSDNVEAPSHAMIPALQGCVRRKNVTSRENNVKVSMEEDNSQANLICIAWDPNGKGGIKVDQNGVSTQVFACSSMPHFGQVMKWFSDCSQVEQKLAVHCYC